MQAIYKIDREDDDSIKVTLDKDVVTIESHLVDGSNEFVILSKTDFESIIWNYLDMVERKTGVKQRFNSLFKGGKL